MLKKIMYSLMTIVVISGNLLSQGGSNYVNREFQTSYGNPVFNPILNPFGLEWSYSIKSVYGGLITVGHSAITGQGENILLTKYNSSGTMIFQVNYNTASTQNDYGISLYAFDQVHLF